MDWSGLFSGLLENLANFFNFLPQLIYFIIGCCLQGIDVCQFLFRKIIGLDTYYYDGTVAVNPINFGDDSSGDLIMQIFKNVFLDENFSVIKIAFISMIIIGSILLLITTIAAMIRVEYRPDDKAGNSKGKIISSTIKAMGAFFAVPIICYFGIVIGNVALWGLEQATSPSNTSLSTVGTEITNKLEPSVTVVQDNSSGTTTRVVSYDYYSIFGVKVSSRYTPMSSVAMKVSLVLANRVKTDDDFYTAVSGGGDTEDKTLSFGIFNAYAGKQNEKELTANAIDSMFMLNAKLKTPQVINDAYKQWGVFQTSGTIQYFDRYDVGLVNYYYNLWYFMWPISIVFVMVVGNMLFGILFGLIKRIYMVFALLLVSPIAISMWPLDGGKSIGSWRGKFTSEVFSAYGSVLALNLFYLVYPVIYSFSFFGSSNTGFSILDVILQFCFVIAGAKAIKDIDAVISGFFGAKEGFIDSGEKAKEDIKGTALKAINKPIEAGKIATRVGMGALRAGWGVSKAAYGVGRAGVRHERMKNKEKDYFENSRKGNVSDDDLRNNVRNNVIDSEEFSKARDLATDNAMNEKYKNYQEMGGKLTQEQIGSLTGDAKSDWENMSIDEKKNFMGDKGKYDEKTARMAYLHDRHALESALNGATALEYNRNIKKNFTKEFMNDKTGTWRNSTTYLGSTELERAKQHGALVKSIDETLKYGRPSGELGTFTLNKKNTAIEERQIAREKAEKYKTKLDKMETASSMLKRYSVGGAKDIGKGIGSIFRAVSPPPPKK